MISSTARIATERPAFYLARLCEHFAEEAPRHAGREIEVAFDDDEGFVAFAPLLDATLRFDARTGDALVVEASGADHDALARVQGILTEHVERFGQQHALAVTWGRASGARATG